MRNFCVTEAYIKFGVFRVLTAKMVYQFIMRKFKFPQNDKAKASFLNVDMALKLIVWMLLTIMLNRITLKE